MVVPPREHLEAREAGAHAHEVLVDVLGLGREDVTFEPVHQVEIVGEAAKENHRGVRVRVDESRQDDPAARIDPLGVRMPGLDFAGGPYLDDASTGDGDRAALDDGPRRRP